MKMKYHPERREILFWLKESPHVKKGAGAENSYRKWPIMKTLTKWRKCESWNYEKVSMKYIRNTSAQYQRNVAIINIRNIFWNEERKKKMKRKLYETERSWLPPLFLQAEGLCFLLLRTMKWSWEKENTIWNEEKKRNTSSDCRNAAETAKQLRRPLKKREEALYRNSCESCIKPFSNVTLLLVEEKRERPTWLLLQRNLFGYQTQSHLCRRESWYF